MSACKTRSPTVGPRKFGRLRGAPGPLGWGFKGKQDQAHCPLCIARLRATHKLGTGTAWMKMAVAIYFYTSIDAITALFDP